MQGLFFEPTPGLEPGTPSLREPGLASPDGLKRLPMPLSTRHTGSPEDASGRARLDAFLTHELPSSPLLYCLSPFHRRL
jgi:hypothetical protein